ncbi:MAG TPA: tRNA uridine-5-carboxymethylaminomethyl(34) synthesis GTPase MnmE, partial [Gammaproteobacteria bacterium]|nr:tRNA uridine-5-carboxymethylaminomethyl(34) synthesis GTPase MnmE [Gammaproteobacteria bacterium]
DLAQAEAIADLIDSGSAKAARSAMRSLQGEFSNKVNFLVDTLINLRLHIEAALDFPEEEIDFLSDNRITQKFENLKAEISQVFEKARQGSLLREGLNLVIVGQPNAGKSSLLNRLAGRDAAIVTHIPGTTRDVLKEYIQIDGMPLHILDTAGLRDSEDIVEQEGIKRTWNEIHQADLIALLIDDNAGFNQQDQLILDQLPSRLPVLRIHNKIDISQHAAGKSESEIYLSAKTGEGFTELEIELKKIIGYQEDAEGLIIARRRHLDALETASEEITAAENQLIKNQAGELVAEHLRVAQDALSTITGKFTADDLLGEIFSSFCIGK